MNLFIPFSPRPGLLFSIGRASSCMIRVFRTIEKLGKYSTYPKVIRPFRVSFHFTAMFPLLLGHCQFVLFGFLSTSCF